MGVLENALLLGTESTYGTAATLTRAYEAMEDEFEDDFEPLESAGFRAGLQTLRSDRSRLIRQGGEGPIQIDVLNKGMGLLLDLMFGATTPPALVGVTDAHEASFATTPDGPVSSATVQLLRSKVESGTQQFTHLGCVCAEWELAAEVGEYLKLTPTFDFQTSDTTTAAGTPVYPATAVPFSWDQIAVTIGGSPIDLSKLELSCSLGMKTDRRFLRASPLKKQPRRSELPEYEGEAEGEFSDLTQYNRFVAGDVMPLVLTATGALIETGFNYLFEITCPAIQYRGSSPKASTDDLTVQTNPFRVLHDGASPAITARVVSTDTAL